MMRFFRRCWCMLWLGCALSLPQKVAAFALEGPGETWQTTVMGYARQRLTVFPDGITWSIFTTPDYASHPMNLGEEYRYSVPNLFYACDSSFLDYFGSVGLQQVDAAAAVFNNLTNVSSFSSDLSEFPVKQGGVNGTAAALHLFDLKSAVMEVLIERLGLIDPERWVWALRSRELDPGSSCPNFHYAVVQRNFDPLTLAPSRYVNGNLFTYTIFQSCPIDFGDAVEVLVDPNGTYRTALASPKISNPDAFFYGAFHTGLTFDDAGGLRYLYQTNNMNFEASPPDATFFQTNSIATLVVGSNLNLFAAQALTNDAVTLAALYPGLVILGTTNTFANVWTTNITAYFTNYPFDPVGTPPHVAFATNRTVAVQTLFNHTFANTLRVTAVPGGFVTTPMPNIPAPSLAVVTSQTNIVVVTNRPLDPVGVFTIVTNTSSKTYTTNTVSGEFLIVSNNLCDFAIIATQLTNVIRTTNIIVTATNTVGPTNVTGAILSFTTTRIDYFTNHSFVGYQVICTNFSVALRQGLEKITFTRHDFDSLLGRFFSPVTNDYTMIAITNNLPVKQKFRRIVTRPDILFSAGDISTTDPRDILTVQKSTPTFNGSNALSTVAGPGTIEGPAQFVFNKVGPIYLNGRWPFFADERGSLLNFTWATFDESTNAPVIYPIGSSIYPLANQVLLQVDPPDLPSGNYSQPYIFNYTNPFTGVAFANTLSGHGGQPPYTFALSPNSPSLPSGLSLTVDGVLSGTPAITGTFDILVRMSDSAGTFVDRYYLIVINP